MAIGPMSDAERFRFDLQGFLVRRGVLSPGDVAALHAAIDVLDVPRPGGDLASQRFTDFLPVARRFRDLIDHPAVLEIVRETCGPNVRLDHAYGIVMSKGTSGLGLHGGGTPFDPAQQYRGSAPGSSPRSGPSSTTLRVAVGSCASPAVTSRRSRCPRRSTGSWPCRSPSPPATSWCSPRR
jgi:hypothetical protein